MVVTTKSGPLCEALMSKTDVKAHTADFLTGNQCSLIGSEPDSSIGSGQRRYPRISLSPPLPTRTLSHTRDLTAHPCRLFQITSSCQQVHREPVVHGCVRETGIRVSQVLLRGTEVSLKLTSRGIIRSFRSSKGAVHAPNITVTNNKCWSPQTLCTRSI